MTDERPPILYNASNIVKAFLSDVYHYWSKNKLYEVKGFSTLEGSYYENNV
jgi:hypothetical protein